LSDDDDDDDGSGDSGVAVEGRARIGGKFAGLRAAGSLRAGTSLRFDPKE
jgi:hypothetical protein